MRSSCSLSRCCCVVWVECLFFGVFQNNPLSSATVADDLPVSSTLPLIPYLKGATSFLPRQFFCIAGCSSCLPLPFFYRAAPQRLEGFDAPRLLRDAPVGVSKAVAILMRPRRFSFPKRVVISSCQADCMWGRSSRKANKKIQQVVSSSVQVGIQFIDHHTTVQSSAFDNSLTWYLFACYSMYQVTIDVAIKRRKRPKQTRRSGPRQTSNSRPLVAIRDRVVLLGSRNARPC